MIRHVLCFAALVSILAFLLSLPGCSTGPKPLCSTPCGLNLWGPIPEPLPESLGQPRWTCPELDRVEREALRAFAEDVIDPRFAGACPALYGWSVQVAPTDTWISAEHRTQSNPTGSIAGVTYCAQGSVWVGNAPPLASALPHEMAHVIQRCSPADHSDWQDAGINRALIRVELEAKADRARCFDFSGGYIGPLDGGVCQ